MAYSDQTIRDYVNYLMQSNPTGWVNDVAYEMDRLGVSPAQVTSAFAGTPGISESSVLDAYTQARPQGTFVPPAPAPSPPSPSVEPPTAETIGSYAQEFLGRPITEKETEIYLRDFGSTISPEETSEFIRRSQQEILNRGSLPVNNLFEGGKTPSLDLLRSTQSDPLTQALSSFDQYLLAGKYPEAKSLLDSTISTYGLNPTESYTNIATYLNSNPKFEGVRETAGNKLFTSENIANFGKLSPAAPVGPAGGIYQRTPEQQAAYASQLASIPVNTAIPLPVMPMSIGPSAALTRARQPGDIGEEEYYGAIRNVISSGDYTPAQLRQMQQGVGTSSQDINVAFGRGMTPIGQLQPGARDVSVDIPGQFVTEDGGQPKPLSVDISSMPKEQQDLTKFIVGKLPRPTTTSPSMFSPENVRAQLELERLRLQPTPEEPVAGFAEGGLVSDDINRMLQNQRNAIQRESQSRQMLTNLGAPPVKKFSDGGPAGSSSGVRRLKMSGYQEGGDVTDEMFVGTRPEDFPETSPVDTAVSDFISSRSKLVTNPQEFFRVMGENIKQQYGDINNDPKAMEAFLMDNLGFGGLTAYHASGKMFKQLDPSKAKSGVGEQRYGTGAGYTAESRPVAESFMGAEAQALRASGALDPKLEFVYDLVSQKRSDMDVLDAIAAKYGKNIGFDEAQDMLKKAKSMTQGYLYKGDIPDEIIPSFLDWNKSLKQQTAEVKKLLSKDPLVKESVDPANWREVSGGIIQKGEGGLDDLTGDSIYKYISLKLGSDSAATEYLDNLGVRGIRYADPGSKGLGREPSGTSNFVVFRPEDYRIESVNDVPVGKTVSSPKAFKQVFEQVDKLPTNQFIDEVMSAHIGGVGDFGDETAKYYLSQIPGGADYIKASQELAKKNLGNQFMAYRLMPKDQFEALQAGDVGDLLSFSLSQSSAEALKKFVKNEKRGDLVVAEVPLTPEHVVAFGSPSEQEVIIDTGVGWSLDQFRQAAPLKKAKGGEVTNDEFIQEMFVGTTPSEESQQTTGEYIKGLYKGNIPVHARVYLETLLGKKDPITAEDFTKEELADIEKLLSSKPAKGAVTEYSDYEKVRDLDREGRHSSDWLENLPSVGKTLGRFTYETLPDGRRVIKDTYDFYNTSRSINVQEFEEMGPAEKALAVFKRITADRSVMDPPFVKRAADVLGEAYIGRDGRPVKVEYDPKELPVKRQEGSPAEGEISDDMFVGTLPTAQGPSPVDTAVSDFISSRSKLVTDPQEFFRVMGQNLEEYHGKPLREDPQKYLTEQLGPGVLGGIIKPKGGNVVTQDLMESLKSLRPSVLYEGYRPASEADKLIREQMKKEEESGRGISASTKRIFEENKPKAALDDWIQNKLGRYIRTEMGSEDDPVRKLGEEMTEKIRSAYEAGFKRIAKMKDKIAEAKAMGKNTDISEAELADEINRVENAYRQTSKLPVDQGPYLYPRSRTGRAREKAGFSPYPISKSDAGKEWEGTADALFEVHKAGDLVKQNSPLLFDNPWIAKLDPKEIVYQPKNVDEPAMFTHTIDELENALNPNSGLPQNLLLKPEDMQQLSIDKAFRHVNKINDWRMQQRTAANLQEAQLAAVTYKEYPGSTGKLKWQELKAPEYTELPSGYRLEDMDYGTAMLKDAQGNILTYIDKMNAKGAVDPLKQALSFLSRNDLERALKYEGSTMRHCVGKFCDPVFLGQTRVFSLRDSKGEPHITIETAPPRTTTETVNQFFRENPSLKRAEGLDDFQYANSPAFPWKEYDQWLKSQPEEVRQAKGKGNDKPSARYIEFGQDFIASKNWSDIQDLENLDIVPLKPVMLKNAQERGFNPQILTTVKDQPYITKKEFNRLADLFGGMNKYAAGGEVTDFIKRAA